MVKKASLRLLLCVVATILVTLLVVGCGGTTEKLASAVPPTSAPAQKATNEAKATPVGTAKPVEPTNTPKPKEPSPTPTSPAQPAKLIAQGFGQDGREVGCAFIVENPNRGHTIESSQYQVAAYNAEGVVVETGSGYIELLLPGQKQGVGETLYVEEGVTVSRVEVQLHGGHTTASEQLPAFAVESVAYSPSTISSHVTGVVKNPYTRDITDLRVAGVVYDDAGTIIGGGYTYLNFILANGTTGVEVSVVTAKDKKVASVELYPALSGLSFLGSEESLPSGATNLLLAKQGFGQDEREVAFGLLVENPNGAFSVENTQYHVTAYAKDGSVLATDEGYVDVLLPKQTLGIAGSIYLGSGMTIARLDAQIKAGKFEKSEPLPGFKAETVVYQASKYSPKVTGHIVSPYSKDVTNLRVSAFAYNKAGEIIGGGYTYLDFVPANGKAAVEVPITSVGEPASVELYASLSALSELQ